MSSKMAWKIVLLVGLSSFAKAFTSDFQSNATKHTLAINDFAIDLYRELTSKIGDGQNLFFSPYSIYTALAMTMVGASGNTCDEINKTLNWGYFVKGDEQNYGHMNFKKFNKVLIHKNETNLKISFSLANKLWIQKYFLNYFARKYSSRLQKLYDTELGEVDFVRKPKRAREDINKWVEKKTNGKIKNLIKPGTLTTQTRIVLTNAIYFMANWKVKFDKERTTQMSFYLQDRTRIRVPMMFVKSKFGYTENKDFRVVELPYDGDKMSMVVFLPRGQRGIAEIENLLSAGVVKSIMDQLTVAEVNVIIPKFKLESSLELNENLKNLGIRDLFDAGKADLTLMLGVKGLYVSKVVHKAFVDVNEKGTEASAATAINIFLFSSFPNQIIFMVDRPFIFAIRDKSTGVLVFVGKVMNPL